MYVYRESHFTPLPSIYLLFRCRRFLVSVKRMTFESDGKGWQGLSRLVLGFVLRRTLSGGVLFDAFFFVVFSLDAPQRAPQFFSGSILVVGFLVSVQRIVACVLVSVL